jgi:hypothetical protein
MHIWVPCLDPEDFKILGNEVLNRKPESTFCVSVRSWLHSDMHIWVPSLDPEEFKILGNEVLSRKPQSTFCVSVRSWLHSDMHIWGSFFFDPEDIMNLNLWAIWNFIKATGLL